MCKKLLSAESDLRIRESSRPRSNEPLIHSTGEWQKEVIPLNIVERSTCPGDSVVCDSGQQQLGSMLQVLITRSASRRQRHRQPVHSILPKKMNYLGRQWKTSSSLDPRASSFQLNPRGGGGRHEGTLVSTHDKSPEVTNQRKRSDRG